MSESNVQLARRGFAAAARGDLDVIAELLAPDVRWHGGDPEADGACRSRDQALRFMRDVTFRRDTPFPELIDVVDAGDRVVVIMQQPPGHASGSGRVANLTTFRDGKVVEMVHYPEAGDALAAAGVE